MAENKNKLSDPSGRGRVDGYRVIFPQMQHPYTQAEIDTVVEVMKNAEGQTQGKYLEKFEKDFAAFTGSKYAFAVCNCTEALKLAGIFCRIKPGDEVIVPAYTYCASAIPFGDLGAKIVWADINPKTWTIDPDDIERKITDKTKAIVAVHLLGIPCDMKRIVPIAKKHGIKLVEDCAQAMDCRSRSRSFYSVNPFSQADIGNRAVSGRGIISSGDDCRCNTAGSAADQPALPVAGSDLRGNSGKRGQAFRP